METCPDGEGCQVAAAVRRLGTRQARWVLGELHLAGARLEETPGECAGWLAEPYLSRYLVAAEAGQLRSRSSRVARSSPATVRVRSSTLRALARELSIALQLPVGPAPEASGGAAPGDVARFLNHLSHDHSPLGVRTWAVAALGATGIGVADLADLRLADLEDPATLARGWVRRGPGGPAQAVRHLPGWAEAPVAEWLELRDRVVVSPRVPHVFLTCHPSHRGGSTYAAGLPVSARGLTRAHARAVDRYFPVLATRLGESRAHEVAVRLRLGELQM